MSEKDPGTDESISIWSCLKNSSRFALRTMLIGLTGTIHPGIFNHTTAIDMPWSIYTDIERDRGVMERYYDQYKIEKLVRNYTNGSIDHHNLGNGLLAKIFGVHPIEAEVLVHEFVNKENEDFDKDYKKLFKKTVETIKKPDVKATYARWIGATTGFYLIEAASRQEDLRVWKEFSLASRRSLLLSAKESDESIERKIDKDWMRSTLTSLSRVDLEEDETKKILGGFVSNPVFERN